MKMDKGLQKLLKLGFADIIWSIYPVVFWILTGYLWGADYKNGFIIGYSSQFIILCLQKIFLLGSLKAWVAEHKKINYFGAGFLCYLISGYLLCLLTWLFSGFILPLFGYEDFIIQGIYAVYMLQFVVDGIIMYIATYFQYKEQIGIAQLLSYSWFGLRLVSLIGSKALYPDSGLTGLFFSNAVLAAVSLLAVIICIDFHDMKFSVKNWMNREGNGLSTNIGMFIIYFLGVGDMSGDILFLTAYNIMSMYTDVAWDLQDSMTTYVVLEASEGNWECKKRRVLSSVIKYSGLLGAASMIFILLSGNKMALFIWAIEMSLYIPDCIGNYGISYASVKHPTKWLFFLGFLTMGVRLCVQLVIPSLWGIPVSCFVGCLLFAIGSIALYQKSVCVSKESVLK